MVFGIAHIWATLLLTGLVLNYNFVLNRRNDKFDIQIIACPHSKTRMNARQTAAHIFAIPRTNVCINLYIGTNISQASSDKVKMANFAVPRNAITPDFAANFYNFVVKF